MKKISALALFLALSTTYAQSIDFKDPNFKNALLELGFDTNHNGQIERSEIESIEELKISNKNIESLDDLKHFKKLRILYANTNRISDMSVLNGNSVIEEIFIGDNQLGPRLTLEHMPNLKGLYAFRNELKELRFTTPFPYLTSLYIQGNPIKKLNIEPLVNLKSLQLFECDDLRTITINKKQKLSNFLSWI
ncbi:leucine-rich repeat domain-containing protein [Myroides fluvii]|uniref:hypothetical protein n=1 Tax=Myroides fluvii TaxID=2572594 RepID=UPI00131BBB3F|nr:hypothetical protein [Myroides fluvii]